MQDVGCGDGWDPIDIADGICAGRLIKAMSTRGRIWGCRESGVARDTKRLILHNMMVYTNEEPLVLALDDRR